MKETTRKTVKDGIEEQLPNAWQDYEFGYEPRTYTFNEVIRVTYPSQPRLPYRQFEGTSTFSDEFLMGFTVLGPNIHNSISACVTALGVDVGCFSAGYDFDFGLGLRLPMLLGLTSTDPMSEGSTYSPSSDLVGLDWSAEDYTQALGASKAENGNEFVARVDFGAYVTIEVAGITLYSESIPPNPPGVIHEDHSRSFAAPFGPGAVFSLPEIGIPIWGKGVDGASLDLVLAITPQLRSDRFTANWHAVGDGPGKASGGGSNLTYTNPASSVSVGPVNALDGPGLAHVTLDDLRYYFSQFELDFGLCFELDVFGYGVRSPCLPLPGLDLIFITESLYVGPHSGTQDDLNVSIFIENVPPTAEIDRAGAILVNGLPTILALPGQVVPFVGKATDPGLDDITLHWDWDDGIPVPDMSTTYPVPYSVVESQPHAFDDVCLYRVGLTSVDDDADTGEDQIYVVVTGDGIGKVARFEGYWQHQLRGNGQTDFSADEIACLLRIVEHMSALFGEVVDISNAEAAFGVMFLQGNHGSAAEKLDRDLLVVWLNFACDAYDYMQLLDTDRNGRGDTTFATVVGNAETLRMDPSTTERQLQRQAQILHHIGSAANVPLPTPALGSN